MEKKAFMVYAMRQFGGVADEAAPALEIFDGEECETFGKFENFLSRCPPPPTSFVYTHKRRQRPERDEVPCSVKDEVSLSRIQQLLFFSIFHHFPSLAFHCRLVLDVCVGAMRARERERKGAEKSIVSWACVGNKFSPKKHIQPRCSCCYVCVSWAAEKKPFSLWLRHTGLDELSIFPFSSFSVLVVSFFMSRWACVSTSKRESV